jgi:hypothetical protein
MSDVDSFEPDSHTEHCCSVHGCKYGDPTCTVIMGIKEQKHPCEDCEEEAEDQGISPEELRQLPKPRIGYMCKIDFDHELGNAIGGNRVYASVADLLRHHSPGTECGIVKVEVRYLHTEREPDDERLR